MSMTKSGNLTHDNTCNLSEMTRQGACAAAAGNQATVKAAEIIFYRGCLASALANNCQPGAFIRALQDLGTGGI